MPYLRDMINAHKATMKLKANSKDKVINGEWKIQLNVQTNRISSTDSKETRKFNAFSDNVEIMMGSDTYDIITEINDSLLQNDNGGIETEDNGSEFVFDSTDLLCYYLHKISLNRGGSYIESPEWLKDKRATLHPKNKNNDKHFHYAITAALNHQNVENHPERISKIKLFINQYNWKGT